MTLSTTLSRWLGVRPGERRDVAFGFATLLLFLVGHALLENARDTLFLSELPIRRLPWAYIAIALVALAVGAAVNRRPLATARGRALAPTLVGVAAVDVAFFALIAERDPRALFALYVWTGVAASVVTLQFWLRAGDVFDVGRAKRAFGVVAAGGLLGASLGAGLAGLLLRAVPPRGLVLAGAVFAGAAALVGRGWRRRSPGRAQEPTGAPPPAEGALALDGYLWTLLGLVLVGSVVVTGVDFLFKAVVAHEVPRARIGPFLAHFNTVVNAAALLFQVFVTPRLLLGLGVVGSAAGLPLCMLAGSSAAAALGGLAPVVLAKAADGTLRHSLDRAATEILYLPLGDGLRERFKAITTAVGQRGGQAVASVGLLLATAAGASTREIGAGIAALSALWCVTAMALRTGYLERFRVQLRTAGRGLRGVLPPLDVASIEALVAALGSSDDAEVLAALDVLDAYDKPHLVSPLLVHHPSRAVALRALDLLARSPTADVLRLVDQAGPDGEVRAALLRLRTARAPDEALLRRHLRDTRSPAVRCTALVGLVVGGFVDDREAEGVLREVLARVTPDASPTIARALQDLPPRFARTLARELSRNPDPRFATEVAKAIAGEPRALFLETLIDALAHRDARPHARAALAALGEPALGELARVLADPDVAPAIRVHVPRTLSRFGNAAAAAILVEQLSREDDDRVRFKILRALGRMRTDDPALRVDEGILGAVAESLLARAVTLLAHRVGVALLHPRVANGALLPRLLQEEERRAVESVFRVLHVLEPDAGYAGVCLGIAGKDGALRAGGRELLENILSGPLRGGLLALTDGLPPAAQLAAALSVHEPPNARTLVALAETAQDEAPSDERLARDVQAALLVDPSALVRILAEEELGDADPAARPHGS